MIAPALPGSFAALRMTELKRGSTSQTGFLRGFSRFEITHSTEWQSYRTRKSPKLELSVKHAYDAAGSYTVVVKVIDILGNDTTKPLVVDVN